MFLKKLPWVVTLVLCFGMEARAQGVEGTLLDLARIQEGVKSKRISSFDLAGGNHDRFEGIEPGGHRTLFEVQGAGMINHIWITMAPGPDELSRNDVILRMYWDGSRNPCVESPIGPLFGQGWNENYSFTSLPLSASPREGRGLVSYFVMPFSNGARIEIENDTDTRIRAFYFYVDYVEMEQLPDDLGRFHAWYHKQTTEALPEGENEAATLGPQGNNTTGDRNYLIADIEGKGHFAGVNYYIHSPSPIWYGEGDDMFFVDGENWPPSLHGTGTEDYFNTAYAPKTLFSHPYFGAARVNDDIGFLGRTHVYRFHITDPVYFEKSLRFSIEHGHNNSLTLDLASVAYWYQREPHKVFPPLISQAERQPKRFISPRDIHIWRQEWRKNMGGGSTLWGKERNPRR